MTSRTVMPWKVAPAALTVLRCRHGIAAKRILSDGTQIGYSLGARFAADAMIAATAEDLAAALAALARHPDLFVIRARLRPAFAAEHASILRRLHDHPGEPATLEAAPRTWFALDLDSVPAPGGVDPTDAMMAGGAARLLLPEWLRSTSFVSQLTAGAGRKPGLRVRLWGIVDRPTGDAEWKVALRDSVVDTCLFAPVQPHYTGAPVFDDPADDPCHERLAIVPGHAAASLPAAPIGRSHTPLSFAAPIGRSPFQSTRAERYARACYRAIADAPSGTGHPTAVRIACRLLRMARAGLLNPRDVGARIKGAMLSRLPRNTTEQEADSVVQWAWDRASETTDAG